MKLLELLQGKWPGHSLHSALVHLPIGSWIVACLVDIAVFAGWTQPDSGRLGLSCVGLGLVGAVAAIATGVADWLRIKKEEPAWKLGVYHMALNVIAVAVWSGNFVLRLQVGAGHDAILLTALAGTTLIFMSGYVGSLMASEHKLVRTAPGRRRADVC